MACPGLFPPSPAHRRPPGSGRFSLHHTRRSAWILVALLLGLGGCGGRERSAGPRPFLAVDDLGDTVRLAAPATRIVSLIPATTEILFALGLGEQVVGRTSWCDYPAEASAVPSLGDGLQPNLEAIVAARPDLVILYNSIQNVAAAARLRAQQIPTLLVTTDHLSDVPRLARMLAELAGRAEAGKSLARRFDSQLDSATVQGAGRAPARPDSRLGPAADRHRGREFPERVGGPCRRRECVRGSARAVSAREPRGDCQPRHRCRAGAR